MAEKKAKYIVTQPRISKPRSKAKAGEVSAHTGEYEVGEVLSLTPAEAATYVNKVRLLADVEAENGGKGKSPAVEKLEKQLAEAQAATETMAGQLAEAQQKIAELSAG